MTTSAILLWRTRTRVDGRSRIRRVDSMSQVVYKEEDEESWVACDSEKTGEATTHWWGSDETFEYGRHGVGSEGVYEKILFAEGCLVVFSTKYLHAWQSNEYSWLTMYRRLRDSLPWLVRPAINLRGWWMWVHRGESWGMLRWTGWGGMGDTVG